MSIEFEPRDPASNDAKKEAALTQLDISQTQLDQLQDELEDAHQDMLRGGGQLLRTRPGR